MAAGRFDKGVCFYTSGEVTVQVNFPENDISCQWCRFLRYDRGLDRYYCGLTDMLLFSKLTVPEFCPLEFSGELNEITVHTEDVPAASEPAPEKKPKRGSRRKSADPSDPVVK